MSQIFIPNTCRSLRSHSTRTYNTIKCCQIQSHSVWIVQSAQYLFHGNLSHCLAIVRNQPQPPSAETWQLLNVSTEAHEQTITNNPRVGVRRELLIRNTRCWNLVRRWHMQFALEMGKYLLHISFIDFPQCIIYALSFDIFTRFWFAIMYVFPEKSFKSNKFHKCES